MGNDNTPCNSTLQFASRKPDNIIEARDTLADVRRVQQYIVWSSVADGT